MAVVWTAICALAAVAAAAEQAQPSSPQMRTRVLPGHGYIRYEVLPGDDQAEGGDLIVIHEERPAPPPPDVALAPEEPPPPPRREERSVCGGIRAKLVARIFEMQGLELEPEFAAWLERNMTIGTSGVKSIQILGGDPLLVTAIKADGVARGLAEDLSRCEAAESR